MDRATFTLSEAPTEDRRVITVESVTDTLTLLEERVRRWPHAAAVCDDVLRSVGDDTFAGVISPRSRASNANAAARPPVAIRVQGGKAIVNVDTVRGGKRVHAGRVFALLQTVQSAYDRKDCGPKD